MNIVLPANTPPAAVHDEATLAGLWAALKVTPHPMLKLPTLAWVQALIAADPENWKPALMLALNKRAQRIRLAEEDPLWWGWEFEPWADTDRLLAGTYQSPKGYVPTPADVVGIFGGNRASKTVYAVKRGVQTSVLCAKTTLVCLSESEASSIKTVQPLVWFYLKPHFAHLVGRRDPVFKINYSQANGFTDRKLVLPNGSEIHFLTYGQEPGDYEGWEFGAPVDMFKAVAAERAASGAFMPPNVGVVADESMPLSWLKMFSRRLKFRRAKLLWPFTPVKGITPAIKEMVGTSALCVESRRAELLPRRNLPDLPEGHMPYIRECVFPGIKAMAIYFFSEFNKFGPSAGRTYYDEIRELLAGKTSEIIERVAYGLARDTVARAFPQFGPWNIVKREHLPAVGMNVFFTDPASRNWASMWVRVTPQGDHFITRDWPDMQRYGEWAVPTEREVNETATAGWDGDVGPAQAGLGYGTAKYKQVFSDCERALVREPMDPHQARLLKKGETHEEIAERYVDSRAGKSEHHAEQGGTCIIDEFAEEQVDSTGKIIGPAWELIPASGVQEEEGLSLVNDLLDWNQELPLTPITNAPRLYVCEDAKQVIWTLENFTGRGGARGACKDFADLLRYMVLAKLEYNDGTYHGKPGGGF